MLENKTKYLVESNKLIVKSDTANLVVIRKFVEEVALKSGFDDDTVNIIILAVDEACTNIIKHAYKNDPTKNIEILVHTNSDKLEVVIIDYGISFDPNAIKAVDIKSEVKKYKKGGLGMYLMKSLVDSVEYDIQKDKCNIVRLIKYKK